MSTSASTATAVLHIHPDDNVVVCLRNLEPGERIAIQGRDIIVRETTRAGHKLSTSKIDAGGAVRKFGWPIGVATQCIPSGSHVHSHNLKTEHKIDMEAIATEVPETPTCTTALSSTALSFEGFRRESGKVGTRNFVAIISNVNCSASVARMIAQRFDEEALADYPNVDGVISFRHEHGCAMAWEGIRHRMLTDVLGGMAKHPNIGGYLLVGLGCEQATLSHLVDSQGLHQIQLPEQIGETQHDPAQRVPTLSIQDMGGTRKTIEHGVEMVRELLPQVNAAQRTTVPVSELVLALECGGSDGYSGITANPALGIAADMLVACGGTAVLSETAEIYGAEHLLTRRAVSREVAEKLLERLDWWRWYCSNYGEQFDSNPSVGNKAGGLTTITEKSLGAVSKAGSTALQAVYDYAKPIDKKGFVVMDTPGFDPASVTGMVAGGANLVAFTTGRGSCFGYKPVPSFKIASNSDLFHRLPEDMDFNAGQVLEGVDLQDVGKAMFEQLLAVASGTPTCSERLDIGDEEFVPWLVGPVL